MIMMLRTLLFHPRHDHPKTTARQASSSTRATFVFHLPDAPSFIVPLLIHAAARCYIIIKNYRRLKELWPKNTKKPCTAKQSFSNITTTTASLFLSSSSIKNHDGTATP
mmetsp:Transcript_9072/g.25965  ORF Transcript_9072/g.25965 Transcript_9072/m.25965 type:complete len:109 (-) Transcript_9072:181-507(-)